MKKAIIIFSAVLIAAFGAWRYMEMNMYADPSCKVVSEARFNELMDIYEAYYVPSKEGRGVAIVNIEAPFNISQNVEVIIIANGLHSEQNEIAYRGPMARQITIIMPPNNLERGYSDASIHIRLIDRLNRGICSWVNEGLKVPNLQGGNRFLFKLVHPNDETLSDFTIEHLP